LREVVVEARPEAGRVDTELQPELLVAVLLLKLLYHLRLEPLIRLLLAVVGLTTQTVQILCLAPLHQPAVEKKTRPVDRAVADIAEGQ
jgi:hypothetical protein